MYEYKELYTLSIVYFDAIINKKIGVDDYG